MTPGFVLDASATLPLVFDDESSDDTEQLRRLLSDGAIAMVPTLWRFELSNALRQAERRERISADRVTSLLDVLGSLPIEEVEASSAHSIVAAARLHDLTAYDAAYLLLAQRLALPLATRDDRLRRAADAGAVDLLDRMAS